MTCNHQIIERLFHLFSLTHRVAERLHLGRGPMEERRRSPRKILEGLWVAAHSAESVRILDLSATGVLLQAQGAVGVRSKALLRLSVGIEATDDLIADLEAGLARAQRAAAGGERKLADA